VGQEVVTRIEHRGTARRRVVLVDGDAPLPPTGTSITAGEQQIGSLMSSFDGNGLATVRLDRAKEAIDAGVPVMAAGTVLTLTLPGWARFGWPKTGTAD
jgi:folate-binding Fe-S cluster repair protein YgfZ